MVNYAIHCTCILLLITKVIFPIKIDDLNNNQSKSIYLQWEAQLTIKHFSQKGNKHLELPTMIKYWVIWQRVAVKN